MACNANNPNPLGLLHPTPVAWGWWLWRTAVTGTRGAGLEPATARLEVGHSVLLSYPRKAARPIRGRPPTTLPARHNGAAGRSMAESTRVPRRRQGANHAAKFAQRPIHIQTHPVHNVKNWGHKRLSCGVGVVALANRRDRNSRGRTRTCDLSRFLGDLLYQLSYPRKSPSAPTPPRGREKGSVGKVLPAPAEAGSKKTTPSARVARGHPSGRRAGDAISGEVKGSPPD